MSFRPNAFVLMLGSCLVFSSLSVAAQVIEVNAELNTDLMKTTYELVGPNARGGLTFGAVFVIGKPMKEDPTKVWVVLITAAHVLEEVVGDKATLMLHHENPDRTFSNDPFEFDIRDKGKNLYVRNPDADVAAMFIPLFQKSSKFDVLPMNVLVTDEGLKRLELHPGDELLCLGFPAFVDFNSFPVVRSGILASYPLTPSKTIKTFYYNFRVFPGNSGGPVYFSYPTRQFGGSLHGGPIVGVIGLVSQSVWSTFPEYSSLELDISKIVPSSFIIETINMLPDAPP